MKLLLVVFLISIAWAQQSGTSAILSRVAAKYRKAHDYQVTVDVRQSNGKRWFGHGGRTLTLYASGVDKFRCDTEAGEKLEFYFDDPKAWVYSPRSKKYREDVTDPQMTDRLRRAVIERFEEVDDPQLTTVLRNTAACGSSHCATIELTRGSALWMDVLTIDLRSNLVMKMERSYYRVDKTGRREVRAITTTAYQYHRFGQPLDPELFAFRPAKGAKQVERVSFGRMPAMKIPLAP